MMQQCDSPVAYLPCLAAIAKVAGLVAKMNERVFHLRLAAEFPLLRTSNLAQTARLQVFDFPARSMAVLENGTSLAQDGNRPLVPFVV
jgi:hypothetical protein